MNPDILIVHRVHYMYRYDTVLYLENSLCPKIQGFAPRVSMVRSDTPTIHNRYRYTRCTITVQSAQNSSNTPFK